MLLSFAAQTFMLTFSYLTFVCYAFNVPKIIIPRTVLHSLEPSKEDQNTNSQTTHHAASSSEKNNEEILQHRRKMNLRWCDRENCGADDILRERVVGEHNEIMFDHPATGQVAYSWQKGQSNEAKQFVAPRVLLLVKKNDEELLKVASEVVKELTSIGDLKVMLNPDVAAKLKFYYEVDNEDILLFDAKPVKGFGASHLALDDIHYNAFPLPNDSDDVVHSNEDGPDLICTLGGDGLLMYASHLFAASCPPILCVAGGSLGFLTPFSTDEMVDAIRISLGLRHEDDHEFYNDFGGEAEDWWSGIQMPTKSNVLDNNQNAEQPVSMPGSMFAKGKKDGAVSSESIKPKVKFGANYQICLSMRMRLDCRVINREGVVRARFNVLNEVVIDRGSSPYLAALECFCDNVHLTTVQADGIIFSTPTGSTAYSMAAGGSVVHPAVPAILVTPICPHVLSFRSMVFPDSVILRCYVPEDARSDAAVAFDGKHRRELQRGDSVQIQMSRYPVPTINRADHSSDWLTSLKRNFNFNTRARQRPL